ncbi:MULTISPECIES: RecQ family ATP-dependent DNA helicase [Bacteroidales]|jgi:ATP-dependent DNA helicase RecQ|uniref:DNA 3'-5' helicase n=7 Tax=Bacteroidales TaxID=171549 RepID=A0ABX2AT33_9BACT|nr:RecQ family ATP-dependent DNA helicase [Xylanibacter rodentium]NPE11293.1 RecQ family ATP-dependent DNA helicase [Prevotella sp. PJ1A]NPE13560.1 RecQ family ATP-dependent DNA helicase [Xylanibacter rodentium]NPE38286.1 RecQ family ATP-dependent DNA helicase [Prevotella sp. PCJ2]
MSIWSKLIGIKKTEDKDNIIGSKTISAPCGDHNYAIVDVEVGLKDHKIHDIGALKHDNTAFHKTSKEELFVFLNDVDYICGHNIIHHDAKYLFADNTCSRILVDTLYVSPLLFPERPYHRLVKDDKLMSEQMNNPVNDCRKAKDLLLDEIACWKSLPKEKRMLFASLLKGKKEFEGFLCMVGAEYIHQGVPELIKELYAGKICQHADLDMLIERYPCGLAYALALIDTTDYRSVTPGWVLHNYPEVEFIVKLLRHTNCHEGCEYCRKQLDVRHNLKTFFGYERFRTYEGEPLQERAARAAVEDQSLLAIFPTGGGKSLTFQLPALMAGHSVHGLTVVISPLQSLMKDQVDNLADRGITDAVTINGMLDPITRSLSIQRVQDGDASLLYISPEMLRSKTIEKILMARHVVRFVIDEAHCFSSWGQDFRVDYLYIGKFIQEYQQKKKCKSPIPVSCFTATAKQKVIQDICDYFKQTLNLNLELFASTASRTNLHYSVIHAESDNDKYLKLRELVAESDCPTIVYVSRTKRTEELAGKLTRDGYKALPFNGKMEADEKIANQDAFMNDKVHIIVATSAFGMGVDKKDVGLVVHYDISDSLENYVQEAGRAGRDPSLNARCYVLYGDNDLDKHFILLNQTKLSINEIQQVWKSVKALTRQRMTVNCSALEIARQAGWDDSVSDIETRVRTALAALEQSGYLTRGNNVPHVYATGITVKNMDEARKRISASMLFGSDEIEKSVRIIKSLISRKNIAKAQDAEAESRIDYLADTLGLSKREVISVVERMRQEGILADSKDISAYLRDAGDSERKSQTLLERFARLEQYILNHIPDGSLRISCKQLNENAVNDGINTSKEKDIRTLLYFLTVKGYTRKKEDAAHNMEISRLADLESTVRRFEKRLEISRFTVEWLYQLASDAEKENTPGKAIRFSVVELLNRIKSSSQSIFGGLDDIQLEDVEEALLYLSKIGALKLEGGFLVLYNAMNIQRIKDNKSRYKQDDYRMLNEFYKLKIQQVHIVGEYANLMVRDYHAALQYVRDYFQMDYRKFVTKYFKGDRAGEIQRNLTPQKYKQLFGQLSGRQMDIISDKVSRCIVVAAGPGSGKTRVLVHKLASLLLLEDVKHEQLLMLTFSRAAATEFKQRLMELIGNAAHFVEIKTFHSYCFDLLGRIGNLEDSRNVVAKAAEMICQGEVEPNKIGKTVLVVDEAQDMGAEEHALVKALMNNNEDMRVIAVGDDDQNIYEFRGSDSGYMYRLAQESGSAFIEMTENYRSAHHPVEFANDFLKNIDKRIKSTPIISMRKEDGRVEVTRHQSRYMYQPLVENLLQHRDNGTSCVLTQTNEEAVILMALLRKRGINSKLIQSMDGLRFWNMAEMRYLLKYIDKRIKTPIITEELWEEAKHATYSTYERSLSLVYVKRCADLFEQTNKAKYFSDFKDFVFESSVEDFCDISGTDVVVSTIHKAKGREFDNVYMLISDNYVKDASLMRRYYVGITRAKNRLFIHTNGDCFNSLSADRYFIDRQQYDMPEEIVLQLSHKDVYLGFFKERKQEVLALQGGDSLTYSNFLLYNSLTGRPVAKLSSRMQGTLSEWEQRGYKVKSASVRFVVAWKPKDAPKNEPETAVLLADLMLSL